MNMLMPSSTAPPSTNDSNFQDESGADDESGVGGLIDDSTTSAAGITKKTNESSSESSTLARAETAAVNRTKMMVLGVLFMAAAGVGVATYLFATNTEQNDFKQAVSKDRGLVDPRVAFALRNTH